LGWGGTIMTAKALVCKLTSREFQERRNTVIRELSDVVLNRETLPDGLRFTFSSRDEILDKLIDFVKSERLCCDFLSFRLSVTDDVASLELTGPIGTRQFLEHEIGF
jgi:hypothetical protein